MKRAKIVSLNGVDGCVGICTGGTFGALNPSKPLLLDAEEIDLPIAPLAPRIGAKVAGKLAAVNNASA